MSALPPGFVLDGAPSQGPVYGPPPKAPAPPSETEMRRLALAEEANRRAAEAHAARMAKGPGGAAAGGAKPVPAGLATATEGQIGNYTSLQTAQDTFNDDFGGNPVGGLENWAQQYASVGTPGQREWWAAFKATDNQIRNDLFGSALTATEKAAYSQTTVEPGMRPDIIRENVKRRTQIIKDAMARRRDFMIANGYRPEAVDALFAPILQQQEALAAGAETEDAPPALNGPLMNSEGQIAGNTHDNGDSGQLAIAQGETRREDDPTLSGVRDEYIRRLGEGQTAGQLIQWARSAGINDPQAFRTMAEQAAFRRDNPNVALSEYDTSQLDDRLVPLTDTERQAGQDADSTAGAYFIGAGDAATGFNLDSIIGATGGNAERARLGMGEIAERRPVASMAGTLTGGTLAALTGEMAIGSRIAGAVPRAFAADGAYGAVAGAGQSDYADDGSAASLGDRAGGAVTGTLAGLVGSGLGQGTGKAMQGFARGVADPSAQALQQAGVPMTLGQMVGGSGRVGAGVKAVEDRLAGVPVVGDMINARRTEGLGKFNSKAFDKALEPIGGTVGESIGEEAVEAAQEQVSEAFERALAGKVAQADNQFAGELTTSVSRVMALPRVGAEVADGVREIIEPYMRGNAIDGKTMQQISRELRALRASYVTDPLKKRIGEAIGSVEDSVFGLFKRQAPEVIPEYNKAKAAARRLYILEDAVLRAKNRPEGGQAMFTTGQLGMADRANSKKFDGANATARGGSPFHDYQRAGQEVLPNEIPDSGTAGRIILPLVGAGIIGGDAATGDGLSVGGTTLGAIVAGAYTKAGQRVLTKGARGMKQGTKRRAIAESDRTRRALGAAGAAGTAAALTSPQ
jgi:hypothetical protein